MDIFLMILLGFLFVALIALTSVKLYLMHTFMERLDELSKRAQECEREAQELEHQ